MLGKIIEEVSGQSYGDYLQTNIFHPLGMSRTGYGGDARHGGRATGYLLSAKGITRPFPRTMRGGRSPPAGSTRPLKTWSGGSRALQITSFCDRTHWNIDSNPDASIKAAGLHMGWAGLCESGGDCEK